MASLFTIAFLLSSITLSLLLQMIHSYSRAYDYHTACSNLYGCGKIRNVGFPFWGQLRPQACGYPELFLNCSGNSTFITIQNVRYVVLDAKPDKKFMRIVRFDYMDDLCPDQFINPILDSQVFEYVPELKYLTLRYGCLSGFPFVKFGQFFCSKNGLDDENGFVLLGKDPGFSELCNASVLVPIEVSMSLVDVLDLGKIHEAIKIGFEVKWRSGTDECDKCQKSGGVCGYDWDARNNSCYYKDESSTYSSVTGYYEVTHWSSACSNMYDCGKIRKVGFPFWGRGRPEGCGYPELRLSCSEDLTFLTIQSVTYLVLDANPDQHILKIARFDYSKDICPDQLLNTSLDLQLFENVPETKNLTLLYGCPPSIPLGNPLQFYCPKNRFDNRHGYVLWDNIPEISMLCSTSVVVPVEAPSPLVDIKVVQGMLNDGFEMKWTAGIVECDECQKRGGVCGYDWGSNKTTCYDQGTSGTSIT